MPATMARSTGSLKLSAAVPAAIPASVHGIIENNFFASA